MNNNTNPNKYNIAKDKIAILFIILTIILFIVIIFMIIFYILKKKYNNKNIYFNNKYPTINNKDLNKILFCNSEPHYFYQS